MSFTPISPSARAASRSAARPVSFPALALAALLIGGLAVSTAAHPESAFGPCASTPAREHVLQRLNQVRTRGATCGSAEATAVTTPLRWNDELAAVAAAQSHDMAALGRMEHRDGANRNLSERLSASGYRFRVAAENLAFGYESLDEVVDAWLVSESHCVNLMNAKLLEFGLACSDSASAATLPGEGRYWTMVLGTPPRSR